MHRADFTSFAENSGATNASTGEGVAVKKVTNVFSKKILAKRALREIKLLQHFRGKLSLNHDVFTLIYNQGTVMSVYYPIF